MAINKVVYGSQTLIDLTADTVTESTLLKGATAHDASGETIEGACAYDADTQDATALVAEILTGKTAYARGVRLTGTMPNVGAVQGEISEANGAFTIAQGYHDGSGKVSLAAEEIAKIKAENIREGVTILGVAGTMTGAEGVVAQSREVTPSASVQTILPEDGYTHLAQVTVLAIPYTEMANSAGGTTVTIG